MHARPHSCFPMITWRLSRRMIATAITIIPIQSNVATMYIHCTIFYLWSVDSPLFKEQCIDSPMHKFTEYTMQGFTNAGINQCTDSPIHNFTKCTMRCSLVPRPLPLRGRGSGDIREISWANKMAAQEECERANQIAELW